MADAEFVRTNLGKASFVPRGEWDEELSYNRLNMVHDDNAIYVAKKEVPSGTALTNDTYWMKIVSAQFEIGDVETVAADAGAEVTIGGTELEPTLNFKIPRGVSGNESIDDTKGEGDTDYVWSADRIRKEFLDYGAQNYFFDDSQYVSNFELGRLDASDGSTKSSTNIARTADFLTYDNNVSYIDVVTKTGYYWAGFIYNGSKVFQAGVFGPDSQNKWNYVGRRIFLTPGWHYKFTIKKSNSGSIDIDELPEDVMTITSYYRTDKELQREGKPADAEITGDYINAILGDNMFWNTLEPSVTSDADMIKLNGIRTVAADYAELYPAEHGVKGVLTNTGNAIRIKFGVATFASATSMYGMEADTWYSLSCDFTTHYSGAGTVRCSVYWNNEAETAWNRKNFIMASFEEAGEQTGHLEATFHLPSYADKFFMEFRFSTQNSGLPSVADDDYIEVRNLMMQKGKACIPWKPNPNDTAKQVTTNDPDMDVKVQQLKKKTRINYVNQTEPLVLLHFSDIHGDNYCLQSLMNFYGKYSAYIDDILHTGDIVSEYATDGIGFWTQVDGSENILNCIGNHDDHVGSNWHGLTMQQSYDLYYAPYIGNWDVTCDEGKTYYYKDYETQGIRLIVLDAMYLSAEQLAWFESTLAEARENGYQVIVADHFKPHYRLTKFDTTWDDEITTGPSSGEDHSGDAAFPKNLPDAYASAVQDFIDNGGVFICWLYGHAHYRRFVYLTDYPDQVAICVSNAGLRTNMIWTRKVGTKSQDDFNLLSVDPYAKIIRVVKVGVNYDRFLRRVDTFSYNYATHELIYSA